MEEWLVCNRCFRRRKYSSRVFYLTGCDHVFCCHCAVGASNKCPTCNAVDSGVIPVQETTSPQIINGVKSVCRDAKEIIESSCFSKVQYLILSQHSWKMDKAYCQLVKLRESLIIEVESLLLSQKRLKQTLADCRCRLPIHVAPPTTNERNVAVTAKSILKISSNNPGSRVCDSKELIPQKSNHDRSQQVDLKSNCVPKKCEPFLDQTQMQQTSDYSVATREQLQLEYSSNKFKPRHKSSIKRANPTNPYVCKRRRDPENVIPEPPTSNYLQQKRIPTECTSAVAQSSTIDPGRLIDTPGLKYAQWKNNAATKAFPANTQRPHSELQNLHCHNNRLIPPTNYYRQQCQSTSINNPENPKYLVRGCIIPPEFPKQINEKTSDMLVTCAACPIHAICSTHRP